jgi:hypothetical protein
MIYNKAYCPVLRRQGNNSSWKNTNRNCALCSWEYGTNKEDNEAREDRIAMITFPLRTARVWRRKVWEEIKSSLFQAQNSMNVRAKTFTHSVQSAALNIATAAEKLGYWIQCQRKPKNGAMQDVLSVKEREHVLAECGLTRNEAEYNFHVSIVTFQTTPLMYDLNMYWSEMTIVARIIIQSNVIHPRCIGWIGWCSGVF